jgi:hypothetical protein
MQTEFNSHMVELGGDEPCVRTGLHAAQSVTG